MSVCRVVSRTPHSTGPDADADPACLPDTYTYTYTYTLCVSALRGYEDSPERGDDTVTLVGGRGWLAAKSQVSQLVAQRRASRQQRERERESLKPDPHARAASRARAATADVLPRIHREWLHVVSPRFHAVCFKRGRAVAARCPRSVVLHVIETQATGGRGWAGVCAIAC